MDPPINAAQPLRLFELGSDTFQRLCRGMFRELPDVRSAEIYGKSGQAQRGIDIEVALTGGSRWVVQCKACEKNTLKHLSQAVEDFLPHLPFWKDAGIQKFIVAFGCGVEDPKTLDRRRQFESDFADHGIVFELWDSSEIQRRLQSMRSVVEQFLPQHLSLICGSPPMVTAAATPPGSLLVSSVVLEELSVTHNERLDNVRDLIRRGDEAEAESELRQIPGSASWSILSPRLQARVFRMLASIALNRRRDTTEAERFLARARTTDPSLRLVIPEAAIINIKEGAEAALVHMSSPLDRDEWNMYLALLINAGRSDEVVRWLDAPAFEPDAETLRLLALAHLYVRDVEHAITAARKAEKLAPEWTLVQRAVALSEYFLAVAPIFEGWRHWSWPLPVPWHLIRSDGDSRESLAAAHERFVNLGARQAEGSEEWREMVGWQLACLANDSAKQAEAATLAKKILDVCPDCIPAVVWSVGRDYNFNWERSINALENVCHIDPDNTDAVQALFTVLAAQERFAESGDLLDRHREAYDKAGLTGPWLFQRAQVSMAQGDAAGAQRLLEEQKDPALAARNRIVVARVAAKAHGWSKEALQKVDAELSSTASPHDLFLACEAHHLSGDHGYVIDRARELVRSLGTEPALRLVLDACAAARQFAKCLELMEEFRTVFRDGVFPDAVHRLRVTCLKEVGRLLEAEQELRVLAEKGGVEDRFQLFHLQLSTGKPTEASVTARSLLHDERLTPEGLLQIAERLRPDDPELAKTFFAEATAQGLVTPQGAAMGMQVGFNLGLDDSIPDLVQKAIAGAEGPGSLLKPYTLEQLLEMAREWNRNRSELEGKYRSGVIPIHGFAHSLREPLAGFFHRVLSLNESGDFPPDRIFAVYARYGANRKPRPLPATATTIFLDITTILLAEHLDLLSLLESAYSPLHISSWVMESLRDQLERLSAGQPAKIPPKEAILKLVTDGSLTVVDPGHSVATLGDPLTKQMGARWCALLECAKRGNGHLIDFLPLASNSLPLLPVQLPEALKPFVRGAGDVLDALERTGALTSADNDRAVMRLGSVRDHRAGAIVLNADKTIALEAGIAELLASAGLLSHLCTRAKVVIAADERLTLQAELKSFAERHNLLLWLRTLRERLRTGLDRGTYVEEPNADAPHQFRNETHVPEFRCLADLLNEKRPASILSCCDDRMLSRVSKIGESPVVGLFDVLVDLLQRGKIEGGQLFAVQHRLRAGNVRYLPPSAEEFVYHIRKANMEGANLRESPELASLRQYCAACLLDWDSLQRLPQNHPEALERSEVLFLPELQNAVRGALISLWKQKDIDVAVAVAGSNWLVESVWVDIAALPTLSIGPGKPLEALVGVSEAQLAIEGISIPRVSIRDQSRHNRRSLYLSWMMSCLGDEPRRIRKLAAGLKRFLLSLVTDAENSTERDFARKLIAQFMSDLPEALDSAIHFTRAELKQLEWNQFSPVNFGDVTFDGAQFWPAAQRALRGQAGVISANVPAGVKFDVSSVEPQPALRLAAQNGAKPFRVTEPALSLLTGREAERLTCLKELRPSLGLSKNEAAAMFPKLARKRRIDLLMRDVVELRNNSFASQCAAVSEGINLRRRLDVAVARPRGTAYLLHHLRLPSRFEAEQFPTLLENASAILLDDEGFEEAFARIASLPVKLPGGLSEAYCAGDARLGERLIDSLSSFKAPNLRAQAATLLLQGNEAEQVCGAEFIAALASEESSGEWELFHRMLLWSESCTIQDSDSGVAPTAGTLAAVWMHATGLRESFPPGKVPESVIEFYRSQNFAPAVGAFDSPVLSENDVANPRAFNVPRFLIGIISHQVDPTTLCSAATELLRSALAPIGYNGESQLPALDLLEQRSTMPNRLTSFLDPFHTSNLTAVLGSETATRFSEETLENELHAYIQQAVADSKKIDAWACIGVFLRTNPPTDKQKALLSPLISAFSFSDFEAPTFDQLQAVAGSFLLRFSIFRRRLRSKLGSTN